MKRILLTVATTISVICMMAQNYTPIDNESAIKFSIKNFGLTVNGSFKGLKGKISYDPTNPAAGAELVPGQVYYNAIADERLKPADITDIRNRKKQHMKQFTEELVS